MDNSEHHILFIVGIRWLALLQTAILYVLGIRSGPVWLFMFLALYCLLIMVCYRKATCIISNYPITIQIDLIIAAASIWLAGGTWKSPYFIYAFTSLMLASLFYSLRYRLIIAVCFCTTYTIGILIQHQSLSKLIMENNLDTLVSNYIAFFLTVIFFGYPAYIIRQINEANRHTVNIEDQLQEAKLILEGIECRTLTPRELEVLSMLGEAKTNERIAKELYVSESTVKSHLYSIYKKLGITSRAEAVLHIDQRNSESSK